MTTPQLEAIRRREREATREPWEFFQGDLCAGEPENRILLISGTGPLGQTLGVRDEDFEFIAHARQDIKDLLAMVDSLREEIRVAKAEAYEDAAKISGDSLGSGWAFREGVPVRLKAKAAALRQGEGK